MQRGHERPFVSSPPLYYKPCAEWTAVWSACLYGCQINDSWLPLGVYAAEWAHTLLVGVPWRQKNRTPPQVPSRVAGNYAASRAVLQQRRNDQCEFGETLKSEIESMHHHEFILQINVLKTGEKSKRHLVCVPLLGSFADNR